MWLIKKKRNNWIKCSSNDENGFVGWYENDQKDKCSCEIHQIIEGLNTVQDGSNNRRIKYRVGWIK